ncbi:TetR/AcrR family transcriptional regulator [Lapidilactobacillus gannanensis]|uniref:TetR/AcrR family transcriptional regulator n=1 Tax=Lapidilactobacillus gannanensis TaxID=2486002 RepID=A0ABW4BN44_9LACO|nr:TetR/AcrR family transcriptional regulator [Lapidilactobacillus gannanensis]MCH4056581.1 TetR/AcrR family transcriptional regulator [Lactobacillaceae bacterium]
MPKTTFLNLSDARRREIDQLLVETFYDTPASQVKVATIVAKMGMSRGAFYKYFENIDDAFHYTLGQNAKVIRHDILYSIDDSDDNFFDGIENYLRWCTRLSRNSYYWQRLSLLTRSTAELAYREVQAIDVSSDFVKQVIAVIRKNQLNIDSDDEMISFLYFMLEMIISSLNDYIVNHWTTEQLLRDFGYRRKWLITNLEN